MSAPAPAPKTSRRRAATTAALACAAGLALSWRVVPYRLDDAYVAFRYAANVAAGHGAAWNVGAAPVEGFSSPLWVLLLALASRAFGADALPAAATALGLAGYAAGALLLWRTGRDARGAAFAVALWTLAPGATFHAPSGLETTVFAALVLAVHASATSATPPAWGALAAFVAAWTRPEAPWLAVALAAQLAAARALRPNGADPTSEAAPSSATALAAPLAGVALGTAALLAARWHGFHALLPNTYFAKEPSLAAGASSLLDLLRTPWCALAVALGVAGAALGGRAHRGLAAAGAAWVVAGVVEGGDWMPEARLFQPALVLFAAASSGCVPAALARARTLALAAGALALACCAWSSWRRGDVSRDTLATVRVDDRALAAWVASAGLRSVAAVDIGQLGFALPEVEVVDLAGLTDPRIARLPGPHLSKPLDAAYVVDQRRPEAVVLRLTRVPDREAARALVPTPSFAASTHEASLLASPAFGAAYRLLFVQTSAHDHEPFLARALYVRRDLALPAAARPMNDVVFVPHPGVDR